ncbi:biotin/lipoyl-binding protein [Bradyrhizobium sp. SK17]|uniref:biotin/lipoyl-binding protein n=1 Tax=Bradyrhizobium sp. SK17 TaxID=2057741 RepID=UPI0012FD915D|nr:biotin/lipoyl-binding protein [Bradyrhizobium sp. SK17]
MVSSSTQREFLPAALEIMETPASPVGRAIGLTIVLLIVFAVVWSVLSRIDIVATASGKIVPTGRTKLVQPLDPGVVTAILVQDGDTVTAGQVVVRLDPVVAVAERNHVGHDLMGARLDAARLSALKTASEAGAAPVLSPPKEPRRCR